jgi:hypothetical protein
MQNLGVKKTVILSFKLHNKDPLLLNQHRFAIILLNL